MTCAVIKFYRKKNKGQRLAFAFGPQIEPLIVMHSNFIAQYEWNDYSDSLFQI